MHAIKKAFKAAAKRAGLERVSPYCLRHTMATELRARGVPEWETMVFLVHKSQARTTERYARFRPDYLGHAAKAIDAYFAELRQQFGRLLPDQIFNPVRATSVPVPKVEFRKSLEMMVGGTGIEPVTPAMSRQELQRDPLIFLHMDAPLVCVCATNVLIAFSLAGSLNQRALCYRREFLLCACRGPQCRQNAANCAELARQYHQSVKHIPCLSSHLEKTGS